MSYFIKNLPEKANIKTGAYTGDGNDDRNIDIGVDLAGKANVLVFVKSTAHNSKAPFRIEYGQGDNSCFFTANLDGSDRIQLFNSTGFQVGSNIEINYNGYPYVYIAIWQD